MGEIQMKVPWKRPGKISMRNGDSLQLMHVSKDYIKAVSVN